MKATELNDLLKIVEAKYQIQQQEFQKLVAEENSIRAELSKIDQQAKAAEVAQGTEMRAIGADVIWKSWVGRTKINLNMKLAQILAQKEFHIRQVKRAYGKVIVTQQMSKEAGLAAKRKIAQDQISQAIDQSLFSSDPGQ